MSDDEAESWEETVRGWFDAAGEEHGGFARIHPDDRLHPSRRLCGFLKLAACMADPAEWDCHAEHDVVYLCDTAELRPDVTAADVTYLARCGIFAGEYGLQMFT